LSFNKTLEKNDFVTALKKTTPARIGIGHAGGRYTTRAHLKFREDLAASRDAVHREVSGPCLTQLKLQCLKSKATSRVQFLMDPSLGRFLEASSRQIVEETATKNCDIQILVSDGLSSEAFENNVPDMLPLLITRLKEEKWVVGVPFFIKWGRVGILDDFGEIVRPKASIILLGERPGLGISDSLSAYFEYEPCLKRVESDRNVLSNIHRQGIPPTEASLMLAEALIRILKIKKSGMQVQFDFA
jgi:ethanolamine ammonia-lyase small subunit